MEFDIDYLVAECGLTPSQYVLIHVGGSTCQEAEYYEKFGFDEVLWIEALPDVYKLATAKLVNFKRQRVIQALVWEEESVSFALSKATNDGESTSVLEPKRHLDIHPWVNFSLTSETLESTTLDNITRGYTRRRFLLVLDVQGAESMVIFGGAETLLRTDVVFSEVSAIELYKNQALVSQIIRELEIHDFQIVQHDITSKSPYGDALFIRSGKFNLKKPIPPVSLLYFKLVKFRKSKVMRQCDNFYRRIRRFLRSLKIRG